MTTDKDIARDLTVIYLQNNYDENLSPEDLIKLYKETYTKFENVFNSQPTPKVKVLNRKDLGL